MATDEKELVSAVLDALPAAVLLVDEAGRVAARNRVAEAILPAGQAFSDVLGGVTAATGPVDWAGELAGLAESGGPISHADLRLVEAAGAAKHINVYLTPLAGPAKRVLVMIEDVTARASMERRLAMSERLAAVGTLASQVAHELNNPIDGVLRYLGLAERAGREGRAEKLGECIRQARAGVERMADIVTELLDFSRSAGRPTEMLAMNSLIEQAVAAMSPSMGAAGVSVVCDLQEGGARSVPGNLFQVLCNLMKNAADAMTDGGRLTITSRWQEGEVIVTLADSGPGIPEPVMGRIFEPFFTTKPDRQGTGLGLSICRDILQRSGGGITAANGPTGGAVFVLNVPCKAERGHFQL